MTEFRFLEPLDTLSLHDHRLFGSFSAEFPPAPAVVAGALRSRMLVDNNVDPGAFAKGLVRLEERLQASLGSPQEPGTFAVKWFSLARRTGTEFEALVPAPADLVRLEQTYRLLIPMPAPSGVCCGWPLPYLPHLRSSRRVKPESGYWLTASAFQAYLCGQCPDPVETIATNALLAHQARTGLALDTERRTAAEGLLYSIQSTVLRAGVGFLVGVEGADQLVPTGGMVALGGEGRSASLNTAQPVTWRRDWGALAKAGRFRLVMTSPGIFPEGWRPPELSFRGGRARLVSAQVGRPGLAAGWDLARGRPKPSARTVPVGAVYYYDQLEGGVEWLQELDGCGFWPLLPDSDTNPRRSEGYNRFLVAEWPAEQRR